MLYLAISFHTLFSVFTKSLCYINIILALSNLLFVILIKSMVLNDPIVVLIQISCLFKNFVYV